MKKTKSGSSREPNTRNWVAKHAHRYNKGQVFADRTAYQRKPKHKQQPESWPVPA